MNPHHKGALLALSSAAGFATLPIFIKFSYAAGANTLTILTTRFILAAACLWLILHLRNISPVINKKLGFQLCLLGIVGYGAMSAAFAASLQYLPASLSSMLLYMYPAIVSLLALVMGDDQLNWQKFVALIICFSGLFLILGVSFAGVSLIGVLCGIVSAIVYSLYILVGNRLLKNVDSLVATTYVCTAAAATFALTSLISGEFIFELPVTGWITLLAMALLSTIVGIVCFFAAMTYIGPANASIISIAEPVLTVFMSILLLGEKITPPQLGGGLLILIGILILQLWGTEKQSQQAAGAS